MYIHKLGADWCSGCLVMRPRWSEIYSKLEEFHIEVDSEYFDLDDKDSRTKEMIRVYGLDNPSAKIPLFVFFDADGKEVSRFAGEVDARTLVAQIVDLKIREGKKIDKDLVLSRFKPEGLVSRIKSFFGKSKNKF